MGHPSKLYNTSLNGEEVVAVTWEEFLGVMLPGGVSESARDGRMTEGGEVSVVAEDFPLQVLSEEVAEEVVAGDEGVGEEWIGISLAVTMKSKILAKSPSFFSLILSLGEEA